MSNEWIKISDETVRCRPMDEIYELSDCAGRRKLSYTLEGPARNEYTHFRVLPGLAQGPKRELSQAAVDQDAFDTWARYSAYPVGCVNSMNAAFSAALRQEREAIWAEWVSSPSDNDTPFNNWLFARCGKTEGGK